MKLKKCPFCQKTACPHCNGSGQMVDWKYSDTSTIPKMMPCIFCNGTGEPND